MYLYERLPEQREQGIWEAAEVGVTIDACMRVQFNVAEHLNEYKWPTSVKFLICHMCKQCKTDVTLAI